MIGHLRGRLIEKRPNQVLLDVSGVGYQVQIPLSTFTALEDLHGETSLLIHTHVRDDALLLYGFLTSREKHFFELLLTASGVGPGLALKILSGMPVDDLVPAIRTGDLVQLTRIPGVGRKTAGRIVVELKDKLAALEAAQAGAVRPDSSPRTQVEADVLSALVNLGYDRRVAEQSLKRAIASAPSGGPQSAGRGTAAQPAPSLSFESLLRAALSHLTVS